MKQSNNLRIKETLPGNVIVRNFSFEAIKTRENFALFQRKDCFECLLPHDIVA